MILTDEERWACYECSYGNTEYTKAIAFARAIEAKVLEKLNCLEPVAYYDPQERGFYWAKITKIEVPVTVKVAPIQLYALEKK